MRQLEPSPALRLGHVGAVAHLPPQDGELLDLGDGQSAQCPLAVRGAAGPAIYSMIVGHRALPDAAYRGIIQEHGSGSRGLGIAPPSVALFDPRRWLPVLRQDGEQPPLGCPHSERTLAVRQRDPPAVIDEMFRPVRDLVEQVGVFAVAHRAPEDRMEPTMEVPGYSFLSSQPTGKSSAAAARSDCGEGDGSGGGSGAVGATAAAPEDRMEPTMEVPDSFLSSQPTGKSSAAAARSDCGEGDGSGGGSGAVGATAATFGLSASVLAVDGGGRIAAAACGTGVTWRGRSERCGDAGGGLTTGGGLSLARFTRSANWRLFSGMGLLLHSSVGWLNRLDSVEVRWQAAPRSPFVSSSASTARLRAANRSGIAQAGRCGRLPCSKAA